MKSTQKTKTSAKIHDVLDPDELSSRNGKFRVTMFVDLDVLDEIRSRAKSKHLPYQTYINKLLRDTVLGSDEEEKIRQIVRDELTKKVI
jgi:predicted DNA binding CopG/RHH family protein